MTDREIKRYERFEYVGTECVVAEVDFPGGERFEIPSYPVGYVRVPEGHPYFGVGDGDKGLQERYGCACAGEVTFTGTFTGDDWWMGFDGMHPFCPMTFDSAKGIAKSLALAIMKPEL